MGILNLRFGSNLKGTLEGMSQTPSNTCLVVFHIQMVLGHRYKTLTHGPLGFWARLGCEAYNNMGVIFKEQENLEKAHQISHETFSFWSMFESFSKCSSLPIAFTMWPLRHWSITIWPFSATLVSHRRSTTWVRGLPQRSSCHQLRRRRRRGVAYTTTGRLTEALEYLSRAVSVAPNYAGGTWKKSWLVWGKGNLMEVFWDVIGVCAKNFRQFGGHPRKPSPTILAFCFLSRDKVVSQTWPGLFLYKRLVVGDHQKTKAAAAAEA